MNEQDRQEIKFIGKRVLEQYKYIELIKNSNLPIERKKEVIDSAVGVMENFVKELEEKFIKLGI